ncbi:MAG: hypothetical protein QT11_C0001G0994 [archaeon GW2011_AR20]|nr:MAG: hypothetical protein QT11_C0001G0994 [archaeon GW2011_AR20]MBS3161036.1 hypothetical protein [Candidatus Woesearchaeota archaeon]
MKRGVILLFILLLISLASAQYIFSVDVEVMPKFISAGDNIIVNTNIKSIGISSDRVDIKISYEIVGENDELINKSDRIIDIKSSTKAIQTSLSVSEVFKLSENLKSGNYKVIAKVDYRGNKTSNSDSFFVTKNTFLVKLNKLVNDNPIIFIILLLIIIVISIWRIIHHYHLNHK